MAMASAGQRATQSAQRMQRSSSFRIAEFFSRFGSSPSSEPSSSAISGVGFSAASEIIFRHSVGQTSAQPPQRIQRFPSNTGVTPQSRQRDASRIASFEVKHFSTDRKSVV